MPIVYPSLPSPRLTPAEAGAIAARARKLLRKGRLTAKEFVLLDCLLWSCRRNGEAASTVSYSALQKLAHMARYTIATGLRKLAEMGLLQAIKRRVRVVWGGGTASRQATSSYVLIAPTTESSAPTVPRDLQILVPLSGDAATAQEALKAVRERRAGLLCGGTAARAA